MKVFSPVREGCDRLPVSQRRRHPILGTWLRRLVARSRGVEATASPFGDGTSSRRPHRALAGFTLIEVLVAMFIFIGVMASLYATWKITLRSNAAALRLTAEAQRSRMAMRTVEDALVSAEMFVQNAHHYAFLADTSGSFSALSLVGHMADSFPGSGYFGDERVRRVTFTVESGPEGRNDLVLRQNSLLAQMDEGQDAYPLVLARDITLFQLEFWDLRRGEWASEWLLTNQLPILVRVSLGVGLGVGSQSKRPDQLETRVVRLPAVGVTLDAQGGRPTP